MSKRFSVVEGTGGVPADMGVIESIEAIFQECKASSPVTCMVVYECRSFPSNGGRPSFIIRSYPESAATKKGLMFEADKIVFAIESEEE